MLGFLFNKEHDALAKAEIEALSGKKVNRVGDFYVGAVSYNKKFRRCAFTRALYDVDVDKKKIVRKKLIVELNKLNQFEKRRAHLLPGGHPAMTHPRVARAMVNLSQAEKEICDPFCGPAGILIEGGLCGLRVIGFDIDTIMVKRARINLQHFKIKSPLQKQDATTFTGTFEAIVTDLPYGRNTKITAELEQLYISFLKNCVKNMIKKIVVGFPSTVDHRDIVHKSGLHIVAEFEYVLHRTLSKIIVVLT
jgi:tRNA (guanine10-N2)-dimethyltransferase